jgi:hypothetical protein
LAQSADDRGAGDDAATPLAVPSAPVYSIIHEYYWPDGGTNSAARFARVSKEAQVRFAAAVRLQNGAVNFTDVSANAVHAKLNTFNMERTGKLNAQAGLRWPGGEVDGRASRRSEK